MSAAASPVAFEVTITFPVRPAIEPFSCGLQHRYPTTAELTFPATLALGGGVVLAGIGWCAVKFCWERPFVGGEAAADAWLGTSSGESSTLAHAEDLSATLVDALRASHVGDRNLAVLRSFGVRDWPYYEFGTGGGVRFVRVGVHAEGQFRSVPTAPFEGRPVSLMRSPSFSSRAMLRASDLAEGGYPTEAVLIAFGALDAAVQSFLLSALERRGVSKDAAKGMLRNITTKRLATYLDSVLTLACGRSLAEDDALFKALLSANGARNDAIHNGVELGRIDAVKILNSIFDVFEFLQRVDGRFEPGFQRPQFFC